MVADEDNVVAYYRLTGEEHPYGVAPVDISRVSAGRFAKHWEAAEAAPKHPANPHRVF